MSADTTYYLLKAAELLFQGAAITSASLRERFGVSRATAKRHLVHLEAALPVEVEMPAGRPNEQKVLRLMRETRTGCRAMVE